VVKTELTATAPRPSDREAQQHHSVFQLGRTNPDQPPQFILHIRPSRGNNHRVPCIKFVVVQ
jgi:hypothetical protein